MTNEMKRNPAIEFFRILMMLGIVVLHVCQQWNVDVSGKIDLWA